MKYRKSKKDSIEIDKRLLTKIQNLIKNLRDDELEDESELFEKEDELKNLLDEGEFKFIKKSDFVLQDALYLEDNPYYWQISEILVMNSPKQLIDKKYHRDLGKWITEIDVEDFNDQHEDEIKRYRNNLKTGFLYDRDFNALKEYFLSSLEFAENTQDKKQLKLLEKLKSLFS